MKNELKEQTVKNTGGIINQCACSISRSLGMVVGKSEKTFQSVLSSLKEGINIGMSKGLEGGVEDPSETKEEIKPVTSSEKEEIPPETIKDKALFIIQANPSGMSMAEIALELDMPWQGLRKPLEELIGEKVVEKMEKKYYLKAGKK